LNRPDLYQINFCLVRTYDEKLSRYGLETERYG